MGIMGHCLGFLHTPMIVCLFVWFDSLHPINNLSVIKGRVFLGWTSTKLGLMFLLKDTTQWRRWGSNPRPLGLESSTLPLSHCAPTPRWLTVVMLNYRSLRGTYYYLLKIKEIDHVVFITKMVHVMFHETTSYKLPIFTIYVNPYM